MVRDHRTDTFKMDEFSRRKQRNDHQRDGWVLTSMEEDNCFSLKTTSRKCIALIVDIYSL